MKQNQPMPSNGWRDYSLRPEPRLGVGPKVDVFCAGESETGRKVERSIAFMLAHLNEPLQVATLAAQVNVSSSHFFALFKQWMGCPPMDYFTRLRMHHASCLLGSTSASVKEVAAALGYDDPFYFSRVFKAIHRVPPSQYRTAPANGGEKRANHLPQPRLAKTVSVRI